MLYLLPVSQKPHTISKQDGAGLHIRLDYGRSCPSVSSSFLLHLCYWLSRLLTYSFIVKLLLTTLTPPRSCVHTHDKITRNGKMINCLSLHFRYASSYSKSVSMRWPFRTSPNANKTKETRREKTKKNPPDSVRVIAGPVLLSCLMLSTASLRPRGSHHLLVFSA